MTCGSRNAEDVAAEIVRIPRRLSADGNISFHDLVRQSSYLMHADTITEALIREQLQSTPDAVNGWLSYSEDRRVTSGWYFRATPDDQFEVGYYGRDQPNRPRLLYKDPLDACAAFIRRELQGFRRS